MNCVNCVENKVFTIVTSVFWLRATAVSKRSEAENCQNSDNTSPTRNEVMRSYTMKQRIRGVTLFQGNEAAKQWAL